MEDQQLTHLTTFPTTNHQIYPPGKRKQATLKTRNLVTVFFTALVVLGTISLLLNYHFQQRNDWLSIARDEHYKVPPDFYEDTPWNGENFYDGFDYRWTWTPKGEIFYCANSKNEADIRAQEILSNDRIYSGNYEIIEESQSPVRFEYRVKNVLENKYNKEYYSRIRIFKCSYLSDLTYPSRLDHNYNDTSPEEKYVGQFTKLPESPEKFIEEYWYAVWKNYNLNGAKVLSSKKINKMSELQVVLHTTGLMGGDWGMSDYYYLTKQTYTIDKSNGKIYLKQEVIDSAVGDYHPNPMLIN